MVSIRIELIYEKSLLSLESTALHVYEHRRKWISGTSCKLKKHSDGFYEVICTKNIRKDQFLLIFIGGWGGGVQKSQILAYLIYEWSLIHLEYLEKILLHKKHKESQPIASVIPSSRNESYKRLST